MNATRPYRLACAAALAAAQFFALTAFAQPAGAQALPRVKARLLAFDGQQMTVEPLTPFTPLPKAGDAKDTKAPPDKSPLAIMVTPETRYVITKASTFAALKAGDYAGAVVTEARSGRLKAQEVYLYADALRGSGEGRFRDGDVLRINGVLSAVQATSAEDSQDGSMTLHYRGAMISPAGRGRTVCEGRALPPAFASALACASDAVIEVPPGATVSALTIGDKNALTPGALLTVALNKNDAGATVTPGVVVEKAATAEKPQSAP